MQVSEEHPTQNTGKSGCKQSSSPSLYMPIDSIDLKYPSESNPNTSNCASYEKVFVTSMIWYVEQDQQ